MTRRMRTLLTVVGLILAVGAPPAVAAKGGANVEPSITLNTGTTLRAAQVSLGSTVDFIVTYGNKIKDPRVAVRCYQDGNLVYAMAGPADYQFLLGGASSEWLDNGGPADCLGELFWLSSRGKGPQQYESLAWTAFSAAG